MGMDEVRWSCTSAIRHTRLVRLSSPTSEVAPYSTVGATQLPTDAQANEFPGEQNFTSVVLPSGESSTVLVGGFTGLCVAVSESFTFVPIGTAVVSVNGFRGQLSCS